VPKVKISTFDAIPVKDAFHDENDFSDWLNDNLEIFQEIIGVSIEDGKREEYLGDKRADIIAKLVDEEEESYAIIENQIERSDHKHLGQLITYSAITKAKVAIWIAKEFAEEHIRALNWLNDNTSEDRKFYGVKLTVLDFKKDEKKVSLEVLVKPSEALEFRKKRDSGKIKPYHEKRIILFENALEKFNKISEEKTSKTTTHRRYLTIYRTKPFVFSWTHYRGDENSITCDVRINGKTNDERKKVYEKLKTQKEHLEKEIGDEVLLQDPKTGGKITNTQYYVYSQKDFSDKLENLKEGKLDEVTSWMASVMNNYIKTLSKFE